MKGLIGGLIGVFLVFLLSVEGGLEMYAQKHAIIMVIGGTIALLFFTTPDSVLKITFKAILELFQKEERFENFEKTLVDLAKTKKLSSKTTNPLINYAGELWEQGIDPNLFVVLLSQKKMQLENDTIDAVQTMKNLAKYPPALGMTGTVMGMIALFASLDSNKDSIGSNIALAMTATFFGLIVANGLLSPLGDRLQVRHVNRRRIYANLYKILLLINQGEPIALISGELEKDNATAA